jgi:hypothetical protein
VAKMTFEIGNTFETETLAINKNIESSLETEATFETLSILGSGGFGQVYQVKHVTNNDE